MEDISPVMRFISCQHYGGLFSDIVSVQLDHSNANLTHSGLDNFHACNCYIKENNTFLHACIHAETNIFLYQVIKFMTVLFFGFVLDFVCLFCHNQAFGHCLFVYLFCFFILQPLYPTWQRRGLGAIPLTGICPRLFVRGINF